MADDIHSGKEFEVAFSQEAIWGAADGTASNFQKLHIIDVEDVDRSGLIRDEAVRSQGGRVPRGTDKFVTKCGGTVQQPFTAIVTHDDIDYLLYLVMQDMTEAAGTPYLKTLQWDTDSTQVDFSVITAITDAGIIATAMNVGPIASEHPILTSCIIPSLTLSADPGTNGGRLTASGAFWSGHSADYTDQGNVGLSGATEPTTDWFEFGKLVTKTIGGVAMVVGGIEFTLNNNAQRSGNDSLGNAQNYANGIPLYELTGTIRVKYDAASKDLVDQVTVKSQDTQIILAWGSGNDPADTDGDLLVKLNVNLTEFPKDFAAEEGVMVDIPFAGADDGTQKMVDIDIANAQDRTWI